MEKTVVFLVAFAFVGLIVVGSVSADPITLGMWEEISEGLRPTATVDGETKSFLIEPIFQENGEQLVIGYSVPQQELIFGEDGIVVSQGASVSLFDPVIAIGIAVVDSGQPSSFVVVAAAPLSPAITTTAVGSLSISGSFTDGGQDGGSVTPYMALQIAEATIEGTGIASLGPAVIFNTPSDTYGPFSGFYNYDCTALGDGQCDSFDLKISFTGSGGGDEFSFAAQHEINPVDPIPEPTTILLSGLGLLGMGAYLRRKRNK